MYSECLFTLDISSYTNAQAKDNSLRFNKGSILY